MAKIIDLSQNVAALCNDYPELIKILSDLGFKPLANPLMRKIIGSHMTVLKASKKMNIPMDQIMFALAENGFAVTETETGSNENNTKTEEERRKHAHEPGHTFLARMGKTRLRPGGIDATEWLLNKADITSDTKILEVACNMGTTLIQIAEKYGCSLTGLDLDGEALKNAENNVKEHNLENHITLVQGSAFELPFPDESFDIVINEAMLTMLIGDQKDRAVSEYHRVLKPGGLLLTQDVCIRSDDKDIQNNIIAGISRAINVNVEPLTITDWTEKFETQGFSVTKKDGEMTLLDPDGMKHDEWEERTLEILSNALKEENADFFERMFTFFGKHKEQLGFVAFAGEKN